MVKAGARRGKTHPGGMPGRHVRTACPDGMSGRHREGDPSALLIHPLQQGVLQLFAGSSTTARKLCPVAAVTKPATAETSSSRPVLMCIRPVAGELRKRLRMVPSSPASASDEAYSGMYGLFQAAPRIAANCRAVMRPWRDRPALLAITRPRVSIPRSRSTSRIAR